MMAIFSRPQCVKYMLSVDDIAQSEVACAPVVG